MTASNIKNVYPSKEDLRQMRDDLPNGWCKKIAEKLKEKNEIRSWDYISNVMAGRFKNINVVAAVIEYRKEIKNLLTEEPNQ